MPGYDMMDEEFLSIAGSCKHYKPRRLSEGSHDAAEACISCLSCKNWWGNTCTKDVFHNMLADNQ